MFKQYKNLNLPELEKEIQAYWDCFDIVKKSVGPKNDDGVSPEIQEILADYGQKPEFVFYEGPPSANGMPGIHHVMSRAIKDTVCRFKKMNGYLPVVRKGGWDAHGLPVELAVEKELGITKEDIGKTISVEEYNLRCRQTVMRYKEYWDKLTEQMGYWLDTENPYITFDNDYMESVWNLLKILYDKGYLYKGYTVQPYSPAAGTGLSSHELNMPGCYKEVKDTSVVAMFELDAFDSAKRLFGNDSAKQYMLAWTTTPWTLPSNTALAVGKNIKYTNVRTFNPYTGESVNVLLATELLPKWFSPQGADADMEYTVGQKLLPYRAMGEYSGEQLLGLEYVQLLQYGNAIEPLDGNVGAFKVIAGDFVSTDSGTGIVHIAPSFGADDRRAAKAGGVGTLTLVDRRGKFVDTVGEFSGRYVKDYQGLGAQYKDVDVDIAVKLKHEGKVFNVQKYAHNYPHCWRTDKPVLYYPLDSWFVATTKAKERMVELNKTIDWKPETTGAGRFGAWLENMQDWNLSRSRYWGIPLPIWRTKDGSFELCVGSMEELAFEVKKANKVLGLDQSVPADLHRPYIDEVVLVSDNGMAMYRETDLIDVWFDSGAMPYAQHHLMPKSADELKGKWPADFIAEGIDQTRGWFYTLHAISVMCFDQVAFKSVVANGLVLDENGQKMSKRLGNAVDPFECLGKYGADATRWYMLTNASVWDNLRFSWKKGEDGKGYSPGIEEVQRTFFQKVFNTYNFFALYAKIDGYEIDDTDVDGKSVLDKWVLSKLFSTHTEVVRHYESCEFNKAGKAIEQFVDEHLSNWYVRLSRRRFWKGGMTPDKKAAYHTLHTCLVQVSKMMAPMAPFFSEWLFGNLNEYDPYFRNSFDSVHTVDYWEPETYKNYIDLELETRMEYAQKVCTLALSLRKKENLKVKMPLSKLVLLAHDKLFEERFDSVKELVMSEVNVKYVEYVTGTAGLATKSAKPNFSKLGKRLGASMKAFQLRVESFEQWEIEQLEKTGKFMFEHNGQTIKTTLDDFVVATQGLPGWTVASDGKLLVALDTTVTKELLHEGMAREFVSAVQDSRKKQGLDVTDVIEILVSCQIDENVQQALDAHYGYILDETMAKDLKYVQDLEGDSVMLSNTDSVLVKIEAIKNKYHRFSVSDINFRWVSPNMLVSEELVDFDALVNLFRIEVGLRFRVHWTVDDKPMYTHQRSWFETMDSAMECVNKILMSNDLYKP